MSDRVGGKSESKYDILHAGKKRKKLPLSLHTFQIKTRSLYMRISNHKSLKSARKLLNKVA